LPPTFLARLQEELVYGPEYSFPQAALHSGGIVHLARASLDIVKQGAIIYHGAEPAFTSKIDKNELRDQFHLPKSKMLVLAFGYSRNDKGFHIMRQMKLPDGWVLVTKQTRHERNIQEPVTISNSIALTEEYMDERTLSKLFFACDALVLPYQSVTISGVLFDGLAHGLPFVASDLSFFREFAARRLGILADAGDPRMMTRALEMLSEKYSWFRANVEQFKNQLKWDKVAKQHLDLYSAIAEQPLEKHLKRSSMRT
jgi:glycosyltransferase involved in cell wall biosynthesis